MVSQRAVSIRLSPEGGPEIKRLFDDVATSGDASAQRLARSFARADEDMVAAAQRRSNALAKINAIMPQTATQMRIDGSVSSGFGQYEGSARRSAAAFRDLIAEQERLEERTRRLVASIDPAAAAQDRFNREMAEARALVSAGTLTLDQYVVKLGQERAALAASSAAHLRNAQSSAAMRQATLGASYQVQDLFTQISMGANPINAFTVQGMQLAGQFATVESRLGAVARFLIGPWGLAISGGLLLVGALTKGLLDGSEAAKKKENAAKELKAAMDSLAESTRRATESEHAQMRAVLQNTQAMRNKALETRNNTIEELRLAKAQLETARTRALSASSGLTPEERMASLGAGGGYEQQVQAISARLDAEQKELQKMQLAFRDAQVPIMRQQVEERMDAAAAATGRFERAMDALNVRFRTGQVDQQGYAREALALQTQRDAEIEATKKSTDRRAESLGRQADAMEENAKGALELARAYLAGGAAAIEAEAARKGATDAARRGIDAEAQTRRQLAILVGEELVQGAQSVAQLREETEARAAARAQVLAGTLSINDMDRALQDEAALRPLLKLQLVAQGDAQSLLNQLVRDYRQALADARAEEAQMGTQRWVQNAVDRMNELQAQMADLDFSDMDQAVNAASRAADRQADKEGLAPDDPQRRIRQEASVSEAIAGVQFNRERSIRQVLLGQQESIALAGRELDLVSATDNVRETELAKLRLIFDLNRMGIDLESEKGRKALDNQQLLNGIVNQLERQKEAWAEIRNIGGAFIDEVLSPDTWDDWGEGGKRIMGMLRQEMIRLALLNPIRNMLFGEQNATIGGVLGRLAGAGPTTSPPKVIPGKAAGTDYFSGGAMLVGELGPEILHAPRGARVTTAADTRRMLGGGGQQRVQVSVTPSPLFDVTVRETVQPDIEAGMQMAATQGAAGGAQLSEVSMSTRGRRRLGRNW